MSSFFECCTSNDNLSTYPVEGHLFNPDHVYGYKACRDRADFQKRLLALYREKVLPAIDNGLCGAVCTQLSDVEDEINGLLTYDRKVCKVDERAMTALADQLQARLAAEKPM